ncbi:MAG: RNA polymerase sigma factor [bacterium]|nr:RNA polymerase sigma factor [bacterium]
MDRTLPMAAAAAQTRAEDRESRFQKLVEDERERIVSMAYHLVGGDREAAKDVAQEAFLKAYQALPGFREEASLRTWLIRIVINQASRYRRSQALRSRLGIFQSWFGSKDNMEPAAPGPLPDRLAQESASRARIAAALDKLSSGQRSAFALVHLEGLTVEESAAVLKKSPGTVKSHLHRALIQLRRDLADLDPGRKDE